MADKSKCSICGATVSAEKLPKHLRAVHPRQASETLILAAERKAAAHRDRQPRGPAIRGETPWMLLGIVTAAIVVIAGLGYAVVVLKLGQPNYNENTDLSTICVSGDGVYHIHPKLSIYINEGPYTIPDGIGVSGNCHRPLHTHSSDGTIHVESPIPGHIRPAYLRDFFKTWGRPFSADKLLDYQADETNTITMTVDGQSSTAYGDLILRDKMQIFIRYGPA